MGRNSPSELTAESRDEVGTLSVVDMIDPDGNLCAVSVRHGNRSKIVLAKLEAGWRLPEPAPELEPEETIVSGPEGE